MDKDVAAEMIQCPACDGPLVPIGHGQALQFRCRIGHAFKPGAAHAAQAGEVRRLLLRAATAQGHHLMLCKHMQARALEDGLLATAALWANAAAEVGRSAAFVAAALQPSPGRGDPPSTGMA